MWKHLNKAVKNITGERIILVTVIIFLCFLHNTGLRFYTENGFEPRLYDATRLYWLFTFLISGCLIGLYKFFSSQGTSGKPISTVSNDLQIEADMTRRANLPTHLRLKKT